MDCGIHIFNHSGYSHGWNMLIISIGRQCLPLGRHACEQRMGSIRFIYMRLVQFYRQCRWWRKLCIRICIGTNRCSCSRIWRSRPVGCRRIGLIGYRSKCRVGTEEPNESGPLRMVQQCICFLLDGKHINHYSQYTHRFTQTVNLLIRMDTL